MPSPPEINQLGCTIVRWCTSIAAWHRGRVSNGPTEAINNLIKRVKRVAFGFRRSRNYRIRALLYAGRPNWGLLITVTSGETRSAGYTHKATVPVKGPLRVCLMSCCN